jgi:hypothetical protein
MQAAQKQDEDLHPRRAERRPLQAVASLRRSGYNKVAVNLLDLSTSGFRIETFGGITVGAPVWITLPGLAAIEAKVVWSRWDLVGCEFTNPLHPAILDTIVRRSS